MQKKNRTGENLNVGSLFSGIGGIERGFELEGFHTKWFVENNAYCQAVLRKNFPNVKIYGDITKINFKELEPIDILTGGFPCQDISIAGKKKGITGKRSGLWKEFARAISEIRPKFVVVENVPNLVNLGIDVVLGDLSQMGYDAEWGTICASDFGALHKRERIFIIAYSNKRNVETHGKTGNSPKIYKSRKNEFCTSDNIKSENIITYCNNNGKFGQTGKEKRWRGLQTEFNNGVKPRFFTNDWGNRIQGFAKESLQGEQGFSRFKNVRRIEDFKSRPDIPEPLIRGGHNGVSNRVDRTRALGNAVVPQVAQFFARQIKKGFE